MKVLIPCEIYKYLQAAYLEAWKFTHIIISSYIETHDSMNRLDSQKHPARTVTNRDEPTLGQPWCVVMSWKLQRRSFNSAAELDDIRLFSLVQGWWKNESYGVDQRTQVKLGGPGGFNGFFWWCPMMSQMSYWNGDLLEGSQLFWYIMMFDVPVVKIS